jgi:predicted GTPase
MPRKRILIMGAAGRDFHNFNVYYRDKPEFEVVGLTATQIPNIAGRKYPAALAGKLYPRGIPIHPESELTALIKAHKVDAVVFSYSDVPHEVVMHRASQAIAAGANFALLSGTKTMLPSRKPVIAVCAVRTGSGKSQTTRRVTDILKAKGLKVVVVRHPMPYGDLVKQRVQRFASYADLEAQDCTIEEREEYEPHIDRGMVVYAGVDYEAILRQAEREADVVVWDGGNNDLPFYKPDLHIVVVDPLRAGHELRYHPGEANLRMADVVVINKIDTAEKKNIEQVKANIHSVNPKAFVIEARSPVTVGDSDRIKGKRALVVEDGPTLTHGEMQYGAGVVAAKKFGARSIVDPRPYVKGTIKKTFAQYPRIGTLLPAMGYGEKQVRDLEKTINAVPCDVVIVGTPIDLRRIINIKKPAVRVTYELEEVTKPGLKKFVLSALKNKGKN